MSLSWSHTDPHGRARELGTVIALSSISFMKEIDGITMEFEEADGTSRTIVVEGRNELELAEFPHAARERTGIRAIETCEIQMRGPDQQRLEALGDALGREEIDLLAVAIDTGNIASPDRVRREGYLKLIEQWIDASAHLNAPFVRIRNGAPTGAPNHDRHAQLESLDRLADYALNAGVCLMLENGGDSSDPEWLHATLDAVGRDRLGLVLDIGNFEPMLSAGLARIQGQPMDETDLDFEPVYTGIEKLAPMATLLHAKVHDVHADGSFGPVDLERALSIVIDSGFVGPITVEYEGGATGEDRWRAVERSIEAIRDLT